MKKMVKVILAAAAVVALAVPAMGADKLIVKNAGTGNAFTVSDAGKVTVRNAGDTADVFTVDNTGLTIATKIGLGTSAPAASFHNVEQSTVAARGLMVAQHNSGAQAAQILFRKSRNTEAAPAILTSGDYIGIFTAQFWDSAAYQRSAQFGFRTEGTVTGTLTPTSILFQTGDTTVNLKEGLRITPTQNVVAGNLGGTAIADLATNVTNGFLYIPNVAGALSTCATTTVITGHTPIWFDTTNKKICSCDAGTLKCSAALN